MSLVQHDDCTVSVLQYDLDVVRGGLLLYDETVLVSVGGDPLTLSIVRFSTESGCVYDPDADVLHCPPDGSEIHCSAGQRGALMPTS